MDKLKLYIVDPIDEDDEVTKVSLVDEPATGQLFIALNSHEDKSKITINMSDMSLSDEKMIVSGALLVPDSPIYRRDPDGTEYYIVFEKQSIITLRNNYHKHKNTDQINVDHKEDVSGIYMIESFIKDDSIGVSPSYGQNCPDGTWFGSFKVNNKEVWNKIKSGEYRGFSIEASSNITEVTDMSLLKKFRLKKMVARFATHETDKGTISYDGDIEDGKEVYLLSPDSDPVPAPDGEYLLDDGTVVTVVDGKIASHVPKMELEEVPDPVVEELEEEAEDLHQAVLEVASAVADLEEKHAQIESTIAEITMKSNEHVDKRMDELTEIIKKQNETIEKFSVELSAIRKTPAATPVKMSANGDGGGFKGVQIAPKGLEKFKY